MLTESQLFFDFFMMIQEKWQNKLDQMHIIFHEWYETDRERQKKKIFVICIYSIYNQMEWQIFILISNITHIVCVVLNRQYVYWADEAGKLIFLDNKG